MRHFISTLLLVTGISGTCIVAAQYTADATSTTGASLSPTGANMTNNINPNTLTTAQIAQIQQTLRNDGFSVNVDGVWGPGMTTALSQFQTAHGITSTGSLTGETVADLGINLSATTPAGSANFGSSTNGSLSNTTGESQIQGSAAASMNGTLNPAAGSSTTTGTVGTGATSTISPTIPGNTVNGGVGGATGSASTGGTNAGAGGSSGVGGATGSAGTGGAAGR